MREQKVLAKEFEFYFPDLDNNVLVESHEDESVTIRSTRNNFSEKRKMLFIRELAAEGFIPDSYQWFSDSASGYHQVTWIKDYSWLKLHPAVTRRANRFMRWLLVASCILLFAMMRVLIVSDSPHSVSKSTGKKSTPWLSPSRQFLGQESVAPGSLLVR